VRWWNESPPHRLPLPFLIDLEAQMSNGISHEYTCDDCLRCFMITLEPSMPASQFEDAEQEDWEAVVCPFCGARTAMNY